MVVDTARTEAATNAQLEARISRLEIMLLERDARIGELQTNLDATRQEVVRNLAKLQTQASRAEAASGLAEAEIALQALGRGSGGMSLPEFSEGQARLEESSRAFAAENYGGALYLATQVRALARAGQARAAASTSDTLERGETLFATAVPLRSAAERANVRGGPGLGHEVLFTLDPETELTGHSYTSEWVRVVDTRGREGWVFHTLVATRFP